MYEPEVHEEILCQQCHRKSYLQDKASEQRMSQPKFEIEYDLYYITQQVKT